MAVDLTEPVVRGESDTVLGIERAQFLDVLRDDEGVTVGDLFADEFVRQYTEFESFQAFVDGSGLSIESVSDLETVSRGELDEHVAETTEFGDWQSMVTAASQEYVQRNTTY